MIYIKRYNIFLLSYLVFSAPFILYWMQKELVNIGLEKDIWMVQLTGVCLILGIIYEVFGLKIADKTGSDEEEKK